MNMCLCSTSFQRTSLCKLTIWKADEWSKDVIQNAKGISTLFYVMLRCYKDRNLTNQGQLDRCSKVAVSHAFYFRLQNSFSCVSYLARNKTIPKKRPRFLSFINPLELQLFLQSLIYMAQEVLLLKISFYFMIIYIKQVWPVILLATGVLEKCQ